MFFPIAQKLLYAQGTPLRHIPLKLYLPSPPSSSTSPPQSPVPSPKVPTTSASNPTPAALPSSSTPPHLRVIQSPITPAAAPSREAQTLGEALHSLLPALFPSRRTPILARPVLHGAVVPLGVKLEELLREAAYADGWLHLGVVMGG